MHSSLASDAMTRIAAAALALISDLPPLSALPQRLRLVGRVVGWDAANCTVVLADGDDGLLANLTGAVGTDGFDGLGYGANNQWATRPELKDLVMVTGDLCSNDPRIALPTISSLHLSPAVNDLVIFNAYMIKSCEDLDLSEWRKAVAVVSASTD